MFCFVKQALLRRKQWIDHEANAKIDSTDKMPLHCDDVSLCDLRLSGAHVASKSTILHNNLLLRWLLFYLQHCVALHNKRDDVIYLRNICNLRSRVCNWESGGWAFSVASEPWGARGGGGLSPSLFKQMEKVSFSSSLFDISGSNFDICREHCFKVGLITSKWKLFQ